MGEIQNIENLGGADLNSAKSVLAFEATRLAHGEAEALKALKAAGSMFGIRTVSTDLLPSSNIPRGAAEMDDLSVPHTYIDAADLKAGIPAFKLFHNVGLVSSGGAARRLVEQGGAYVNGTRVETFDQLITDNDINDQDSILLRSGKKRFHQVKVKKNFDQ